MLTDLVSVKIMTAYINSLRIMDNVLPNKNAWLRNMKTLQRNERFNIILLMWEEDIFGCLEALTQDKECYQLSYLWVLSFLLDVRFGVSLVGTSPLKQGDTQSDFVPAEKVEGCIKNFVLLC
jgi:hypothetical protein